MTVSSRFELLTVQFQGRFPCCAMHCTADFLVASHFD